ncbi:putative S-adenosyl-L-methionine hydrolase [Erwinia phage pEp_SNUABM_10]|nr:putative S-adenosyl-L-methionine hydrolase [Erwinia phage pEp_SNUABM_10]
MIHTNEPANQFFVYLSAYRSYESQEVNEKMTKGLISEVRKYPGMYGVIVREDVQGCFKEAGAEHASIERTIVVRCRSEYERDHLTYLACRVYNQDCVLVVNSQTHTASFANIEMVGEYPLSHPEVRAMQAGTFVQQDTGSEYYSMIDGVRWEVQA